MKRLEWSQLSDRERMDALARPTEARNRERQETVRDIIARVRQAGDAALIDYARQFDGVELESLAVPQSAMQAAWNALDESLAAAIDRAIETLTTFHRAGLPQRQAVETAPGVLCERIHQPIDRVGLYIPAGTAPLPSTVLMLAVPARLAGCREVVLCSPPGPDGEIDPVVLAAAFRAGVGRAFRVGGAQAIAAMAYGTESVPDCDKLFGPGNAWVTEAKLQVQGEPEGAAIDLPAGPSEVLVLADRGADPAFVAADLLSQAEHGEDSQVLLVTDDAGLIEAVEQEVARQLERLDRAETVRSALEHARLIRVDDLSTAIAVSNRYAPEHLIVQVAEPRSLLPDLRNAGSIFLGPWSPESMGDYCSGTNHVLPTAGWARSYSGVSVASFMIAMTVQELTAEGLSNLGPTAEVLARAEGLDAHEKAVSIRLRRIEEG